MSKLSRSSEMRQLFQNNDGSLPEVCFNGLSTSEVSSLYELIKSLGRKFASNTFYWSQSEQRDKNVLETDLATTILEDSDAHYFHVVMSDVESFSGVPIPELGVSVEEDRICLDYRMGKEWEMSTVTAFLEIVSLLKSHCPTCTVAHVGNMNDPNGHRLLALFE